jgi:hypothetical protein
MHRCHIVGVSPRTGTTVLAECMRVCFDIDASDAHETRVTHLRLNRRIYLTKCPGDLAVVGPRLAADPHFHVICLMRDPRDVVVSYHRRDRERYWVPLRIWRDRIPLLRKVMRHPRVLVVRYEDLVRDPDGVQRGIEKQMPFLEATRPFHTFPEVAQPSRMALEALGPVRAFDTASIGRWRQHLPRVAGQLRRHGPITDLLKEFGYETDDRWLNQLDGVEPDLRRSHLPEMHPGRFWRPPGVRVMLPWLSAQAVVAGRFAGLSIG